MELLFQYYNRVLQQTITSAGLADLPIVGNQRAVGFFATKKFDQIQIQVASLVGLVANIRIYNAVLRQPCFYFNCASASSIGTFIANGSGGQNGTLSIPITSATASTVTLNVTGTGFSGGTTTVITAGQTLISVPITYDGSGLTGSKTLTISSLEAGLRLQMLLLMIRTLRSISSLCYKGLY